MKEFFKNKAFIFKKATFSGCDFLRSQIWMSMLETKKRRQLVPDKCFTRSCEDGNHKKTPRSTRG